MESNSNSLTWEVHKFGGSSLATVEEFRNVAQIISKKKLNSKNNFLIVLSAPGKSLTKKNNQIQPTLANYYSEKVTDLIINASNQAANCDTVEYENSLIRLEARFHGIINGLFADSTNRIEIVKNSIEVYLAELRKICSKLSLNPISEICKQTSSLDPFSWWFAIGELITVTIFSNYWNYLLEKSIANESDSISVVADGREIVAVESFKDFSDGDHANKKSQVQNEFDNSADIALFPNYFETRRRWDNWLDFNDQRRKTKVVILTGYLGYWISRNNFTNLGRDGSDYTATIMGNILKAESVNIWTDVNGILRVDPAIFKLTNFEFDPELIKKSEALSSSSISKMNYRQCEALSRLGAKILFANAVEPCERGNIPIHIFNSFDSLQSGTKINYTGGSSFEILIVKSKIYYEEYSLRTLKDSNFISNRNIFSYELSSHSDLKDSTFRISIAKIFEKEQNSHLINSNCFLQRICSSITVLFSREKSKSRIFTLLDTVVSELNFDSDSLSDRLFRFHFHDEPDLFILHLFFTPTFLEKILQIIVNFIQIEPNNRIL